MGGISGDKRVLSLSSQQGLQTTLETLLDQLNRCQKALNEFLEVCMIFADQHTYSVHIHTLMHMNIIIMHTLYFVYYRRSGLPFLGSILSETRIF